VEMLGSKDARVRVIGADIISRRATYSAMSAVGKAAREDGDQAVRAACINSLRELGSMADLSALVEILLKNRSDEESQAAEKAMATICGRQTDMGACAEKLVAGLASAQPAQKCTLLRILRSVPDSKSLQAIRVAMADPVKEVQDVAIRMMCDWSTVEAAPDLLSIAKNSPNATYKILALRGYIKVSGDKNVTGAQRVTMIKEASTLVQRDDERKILLGALGNTTDAESFAMAVAYLDNAALKDEACLAAVAIGEHLVKDKPDLVGPVMEKVMGISKDKKLDARAKAVLQKIKK
jgi:hypothetical protein